MPAVDRIVAFAAVAAVIMVIPGPSVLFVVSRGVSSGRRVALLTALGNEAGELVQVVAVAFGLGAIVERSITVFTVLKLVGAAYLVVLGVQAIRHRRDVTRALRGGVEGKGSRRVFADGFAVGVSNPKTIILFTAILPEFISRGGGHVTAQLLVLGALAVTIALISDSLWGLLAGTVREWLDRTPRSLGVLRGTGGLVMIGLGVRLALTRRRD
jgi:threonine/homoserine/homoserine lactone efflux protein